ncbi:MAG: hypothetical protein KAI91_07915, partial [Candidatus Omnitrophica bacterium]|nr:hypothetical protein [Candidatus Omnitrophota bacterium]
MDVKNFKLRKNVFSNGFKVVILREGNGKVIIEIPDMVNMDEQLLSKALNYKDNSVLGMLLINTEEHKIEDMKMLPSITFLNARDFAMTYYYQIGGGINDQNIKKFYEDMTTEQYLEEINRITKEEIEMAVELDNIARRNRLPFSGRFNTHDINLLYSTPISKGLKRETFIDLLISELEKHFKYVLYVPEENSSGFEGINTSRIFKDAIYFSNTLFDDVTQGKVNKWRQQPDGAYIQDKKDGGSRNKAVDIDEARKGTVLHFIWLIVAKFLIRIANFMAGLILSSRDEKCHNEGDFLTKKIDTERQENRNNPYSKEEPFNLPVVPVTLPNSPMGKVYKSIFNQFNGFLPSLFIF